MTYLLFPGRHLVNTRFQETYLRRVLSTPPKALPGVIAGRCELEGAPTEIIFAITSANQENSRFNPIPFHVRAMGVVVRRQGLDRWRHHRHPDRRESLRETRHAARVPRVAHDVL